MDRRTLFRAQILLIHTRTPRLPLPLRLPPIPGRLTLPPALPFNDVALIHLVLLAARPHPLTLLLPPPLLLLLLPLPLLLLGPLALVHAQQTHIVRVHGDGLVGDIQRLGVKVLKLLLVQLFQLAVVPAASGAFARLVRHALRVLHGCCRALVCPVFVLAHRVDRLGCLVILERLRVGCRLREWWRARMIFLVDGGVERIARVIVALRLFVVLERRRAGRRFEVIHGELRLCPGWI